MTSFNEVLWYAQKGEATACPPPVHAAFFHRGKMMTIEVLPTDECNCPAKKTNSYYYNARV